MPLKVTLMELTLETVLECVTVLSRPKHIFMLKWVGST